MAKTHTETEDYSMDVWSVSNKVNNKPTPTKKRLSISLKRHFRNPRQSRFRWYFVLAAAILIIVLTLIIVALAVHFSTDSDDDASASPMTVQDFVPQASSTPSFSTSAFPENHPRTSVASLSSSTFVFVSSSSHQPSSSLSSSYSSIVTDIYLTSSCQLYLQTSSELNTKISSFDSASETNEVSSFYGSPSSSLSVLTQTPSLTSFSSSMVVSTSSTLSSVYAPSSTIISSSTVRDISTSQPTMMFTASTLSINSSKLVLDCEAVNVKDWTDLQIIRHNNIKQQTVAMVTAGFKVPSVSMFDPNFSSQISYKDDALAFVLESDHVYCSAGENYTCIITTPYATHTKNTPVKVKNYQPVITLPKAIVEGTNMTLKCSAELYGSNGTLKWTFRPPGIPFYYQLSINPVTKKQWSNCTATLTSVLPFQPKAADNGSVFRCEVEGQDIKETLAMEAEFLVVPSTFCSDKPVYTVHPHPYSPCNLVVYCFQTGPLVYEINCDPGTCYDKDKTRCVPEDQISRS